MKPPGLLAICFLYTIATSLFGEEPESASGISAGYQNYFPQIERSESKIILGGSIDKANRQVIVKFSIKIIDQNSYVLTDKSIIYPREYPHLVPDQDWPFLSLNQYTIQENSVDPGSLIKVDSFVDPDIIVPVDPDVDPGIIAK